MSSELLALGVSHKTAPVAVRERLALAPRATSRLDQELVARDDVDEAVVISTCNRTELYVVTRDPLAAESDVLGVLARRSGLRATQLAGSIYSPRNCDAARQLYRVTSGLESMVVGEAEVQGQVRRAYEAALEAGTTGTLTNRLFTAALQTGKRVRTETHIGAARTSVASVGVDLAAQVVGDLTDRNVVIVGAGETSELVARTMAERGVHTLFVANRHADRARDLADRVGGSVAPFDELPMQLATADVVVSSTASPHALIEVDALEQVMRHRADRPLVLIDLAVPRDVEPACADVPGVTLLNVDDLQAAVARNISVREGERSHAEEIVEDEIQRFARWLAQADVRPTVAALREHGQAIVDGVLAENAGRWESASERDLQRVDQIARAVMQRLLHEPTQQLKRDDEGGHGRLEVVRDLFGLEDVPAPHPPVGERRDAPGEPAGRRA